MAMAFLLDVTFSILLPTQFPRKKKLKHLKNKRPLREKTGMGNVVMCPKPESQRAREPGSQGARERPGTEPNSLALVLLSRDLVAD